MKNTFLIAAALFFAFSSGNLSAQANGNFLGLGGSHTPTPEEIAAAESNRRQQVQTLLNGHYLRRVNGQIVNMFLKGKLMSFKVESKIDGVVIGEDRYGGYGRFGVTNFTGEAIADKFISFVAIKSGTFDAMGTPLGLYDCGQILTTAEEQNEIARLKEQYAVAQNQAEADRQAKKKAAAAKAAEATAKAVKINQDQADKGDFFGLLRMGERYRTGDGVEKDIEKAKSYLQKAAEAGSETAKNELADLLTKGK